mgnify:CR=1 FL=1
MDGMFQLEDLPAGEYEITFDGKDVPTNRFGTVEVGSKDQFLNTTFEVRPPYAAPVATVAESAEPIVH